MADYQLGQCRAYLVGRTGPQTNSLAQIASRTGFGEVETLATRDEYGARGDTTINYFLIHRHLKPSMMAAVIRSVRVSSDDQIRFAPVILFADDGPFETYLQYVYMGFDDVITLPDKQPLLVQRLTGQLYSEQVYFETRDYFGPDRRRMETPWQTDSRRSLDPHSHTRYTFTRVPGRGIQILRTDIFAKPETSLLVVPQRTPLPRHGAMR